MNANQIINMVVSMVMRRVVRTGVNAGMDAVGKRMSNNAPGSETKPVANSGETQKRMRQTMRMAKRMGKF